MKPYIDFTAKRKTAATNDFEKDFFKLMNNSVFGKTMENIRKHRNIKLVTNKDKYLQRVMKSNFKSGVLFGENLVGCRMGNTKVVMKKPVYLGQTILDLSKIVMYEFHYDYMKPKFEDFQLCYIDIDLLVYHMKTEDFYADIANDVEERFNTSGYIPDGYYVPGTAGWSHCPLPIGKNKKVICTIMAEFMSLRPKLYSYKKLDGLKGKKCKGIKKCVVKKTQTFKDYKNCLFEHSTEYRDPLGDLDPCGVYRYQLMFWSIRHEIFTLEVNKARGHKDLSWSPTLGELFLIEKW